MSLFQIEESVARNAAAPAVGWMAATSSRLPPQSAPGAAPPTSSQYLHEGALARFTISRPTRCSMAVPS